jgi:hypothetical protein
MSTNEPAQHLFSQVHQVRYSFVSIANKLENLCQEAREMFNLPHKGVNIYASRN